MGEEPPKSKPFCIYYAKASKRGRVGCDSHCKRGAVSVSGSPLHAPQGNSSKTRQLGTNTALRLRLQQGPSFLLLLLLAHSSSPRQTWCQKGKAGTQALLIFSQAEHTSADASGVSLE